jgi:hypothetical protein
MKRNIALVCLLVLVSFSGGWFLHRRDRKVPAKDTALELVDALPRSIPHDCVSPSPEELARYKLAVQVLDAFGDERSLLSDGAAKFFAYGIYRHEPKGTFPVCPPDGLYHRVAEIMAQHKMWDRGRQIGRTEYGLRLASRIGEGRPEIIAAIGEGAFSKEPQPAALSTRNDIRPWARTVLASFGREAASFGNAAFALISSEDSLGTGAAQVAAAVGYPGALSRITSLMKQILSSISKDRAIPRDKRNRLYELAYAIYFSGEAGRDHLDPILELMERKVQSWAPPFGMVELQPRRMCILLRKINVDESVINSFPYCSDGGPYEQ